jgi:hypothetical protein
LLKHLEELDYVLKNFFPISTTAKNFGVKWSIQYIKDHDYVATDLMILNTGQPIFAKIIGVFCSNYLLLGCFCKSLSTNIGFFIKNRQFVRRKSQKIAIMTSTLRTLVFCMTMNTMKTMYLCMYICT